LQAFTTHEPAVRAFVRRLVPSRADADDVLQDVSVVLWEKFDEFRQGGDFKSWACGVARYKVLAWLRDKGRERLVLDNDVVELVARDSLRIEPQLEQQRNALEACFERLPTAERELLASAYRPGARIHEVAEASGRSIKGFYQWLYRMRKMLFECINLRLSEERSQ